MQICETHFDMNDTIGLFVTLESSADDKCYLHVEIASLYRWEVRVGLPPGRKDIWRNALLQALLKAESGMRFPIRFELDNLLKFLSIEELKQIERKIRGVSFYVYGVKKEYSVSDSVLRRVKRIAARQAAILGGGVFP